MENEGSRITLEPAVITSNSPQYPQEQTNASSSRQVSSEAELGDLVQLRQNEGAEINPSFTRRAASLPLASEWPLDTASPALLKFMKLWDMFINSLLKELKILNVVSGLLAFGNLTMLQVPEVVDDVATRILSLLSLICILMSLSYGCMYIIRFGTMRSVFHASRWAEVRCVLLSVSKC
ncbi:hypothetical protein BJ165DRAFT_1350675 [Panaeolus papilionaceus]|nr:hypothetical protein BJ165DRAFT_1350675 [Panaeolus papilionaceus]